MKLLLLSQLRDLRRHWIVSTCTVSGLTLAVVGIVVVHVVSVQAVRTLNDTGLRNNYHYVIPVPDSQEQHYFDLRKSWRAGAIPGIGGVLPVLEGTMIAEGRLVPVLGIDLLADFRADQSHNLNLTDSRLLTGNSLVAMGQGWVVGSEIKGASIVAHKSSNVDLLIADLPTAQRILERPNEIDAIWLRRTSNPISMLEEIMPGLLTGLGYRPRPFAIDGIDVQTMSKWNPTHSFAGSIAFNLSMLGALAVLVASFIAYEASSSNIARRALETKRLLSLGASQLQIRAVFLFEALLLALVGSGIGIAFAIVLLHVLTSFNWETDINVLLIAATKSIVVGVLAFLAAAFLSTSRSQRKYQSLARWILTALALGILAVGLVPRSGLVGAFLVVVAFCLIQMRAVVPLLVRALSYLGSKAPLKKLVHVMFLRLALRQFRLFEIPVNAFSIAIATAIGIGLMVSSFRTNFEDLLDLRIRPGLHVANAANVDVNHLAGWEEVVELQTYYRSQGRLVDGPVTVQASVLDARESSRYGYHHTDSQGAFINRQLAARHNLLVGSNLDMQMSNGSQLSVPIVHIFNSYGRNQSLAIVPVGSVDTKGWVRDRLSLQVTDANKHTIARRLIETYPEVDVSDHSQIRSSAMEIFDRTFVLTNVIAIVAVMVAVVGLLSASIAVHERQQDEYRLLRTVGISNRHLTLSTIFQSGVFGILSCAISLPLGIAIAWALCVLVNPRAFLWTINLHFHAAPLVVPISLSLLASMVACVVPYLVQRRQWN